MGDISLWVYTPTGTLLQPGMSVAALEWTLEEGAFGVMTATGPLAETDSTYFTQDARFDLMRSIDGGPYYMEGGVPFFLRYWEFGEDETGAETWKIEAYTPDYWLTRRIVDSYASTPTLTNPLTTKSGAADDIIKEFLDENMVSATTTARNISGLTIEADLTAGQTTEKSAAWKSIRNTIDDLCADSAALGTYLTYGIVSSGSGFVFRTFTGQRGVDHTRSSGDPVIVSRSFGNLATPRIYFDYRTAITAVRALGRGEGISRLSARVEDTDRSTASPYAYGEAKIEGSAETVATLEANARAELERGRAVRGFAGRFLDTEGNRYGERVFWGDTVTAEYMGYSFDCRLSRVHGMWNGVESLEIDLVGSEAI